MASSLTGWLNKTAKRRLHSEHAVLKVAPQRRDLTPPDPAATAVSGLFQRLPTEIRRQILTTAFGGRVIHVDLSLTHYPRTRDAPGDTASKERWRPASLLRAAATSSSSTPVDKCLRCTNDARLVKPEVRTAAGWDFKLLCSCGGGTVHWQWLSRVCQCEDLNTLRLGNDGGRRPDCHLGCCYPSDPIEDSGRTCVHGRMLGESTCHWHIGVSGWLRACKEAYLEGSDVFYGTNTFHLSGTTSEIDYDHDFVLLRHLPDLLPTEKLRSVMLSWNRTRTGQQDKVLPRDRLSTTDRRDLQRFLDAVPGSLPHLEALYLRVVDVHMYTGEPWDTNKNFQHSQQAEADIFLPADALFRRLRLQLREFYLGVPFTIFKHRFEAGGPKGLWLEPAQRRRVEAGAAKLADLNREAAWGRQRVWRRLPRAASPEGEAAADGSEGDDGYWINQSWANMFIISYCFGTGPTIDFSQFPSPYTLDPD